MVWHSSLTQENSEDLERVQKSATKIIMGDKYENYENALEEINLQTLYERRENLCLTFAKKCLENEKMKDMFPLNYKSNIQVRNREKYEVTNAKTDRLRRSAIPCMQNMLNMDQIKNKKIRQPG